VSGDYTLNIGNLARSSDGRCSIFMGAMSGGGSGTSLIRESGLNSDFRLIQNGSGVIKFETNGGLKINAAPIPNPSGDAPIYGARAWVTFSANGSFITGNNIASVARAAGVPTGAYIITFTTAMPTTAFAAIVTSNQAALAVPSEDAFGTIVSRSVNSVTVKFSRTNTSGSFVDMAGSVVIFC
jgi:hypothetical protein